MGCCCDFFLSSQFNWNSVKGSIENNLNDKLTATLSPGCASVHKRTPSKEIFFRNVASLGL